MKLIKWLKRDRTNRRSSDSHISMVASPHSDKKTPDGSPADGDPIRTREYLQALADFRARRSLGPNISLGFEKTSEKSSLSPDNRLSRKNDERRSKTEPKSKRRSLPETGTTNNNQSQLISQAVPQIQFLFSNQIFMPGSGLNLLKKNEKNKCNKRESEQSISPDSDYMKGRQIDFDDDSESPASPPPDFFRDNSLPYVDVTTQAERSLSTSDDDAINLCSESTMEKDTVEDAEHDSTRPLIDSSPRSVHSFEGSNDSSIEDMKTEKLREVIDVLTKYNNGRNKDSIDDSTEASFVSVARKLEETCRDRECSRSVGHFRGVPLVRLSALGLSGRRGGPAAPGVWAGAPVTVGGEAEGEYAARNIHLLSTIRHPNILLLMGISYDVEHKVQCIFEECSATLHEYIHNQGPNLTYQSSVGYLSDVASALCHLNSNGYVHTAVSSHTIMVTSRDVAKLCGFELCSRILAREDQGDIGHRGSDVKCDPYRLMYSSPELDYESRKVRARVNLQSDEEPLLSSRSQECSAQSVSERELLAKYNWQAPELFDDVDGQVFPTKTSDVYSLCMVLWECCNGAIPWKSLTYRNLSDLYLLWQTGIRLTQDKYPEVVFDILNQGLSINSKRRVSISSLLKKFAIAKKILNVMDDSTFRNYPNADDIPPSCEIPPMQFSNSCTQFAQRDMEQLSPVNEQEELNDSKIQVTDIDNVDDRNNNSSIQFYPEHHTISTSESKSFCINISEGGTSRDNLLESDYVDEDTSQNMTMHKTDSTEYCSLLTPDLRRFSSRVLNGKTTPKPSKLAFNDDPLSNIPESSLQEKIMRLNSNFTPKSYTPLHIQSPPVGKLENMASLTNSGSRRDRKKSKYNFDVTNTSLPTTPIARNNKIRKFAWLSGEDDDDLGYNETAVIESPTIFCGKVKSVDLSDGRMTEVANLSADESIIKNSILSNESKVIDDSAASRVSVENVRNVTVCGASGSVFTDRNSFLRASLPGHKLKNLDPEDKFRSRSQSWSSRPLTKSRSDDSQVTGVSIKPLVAIHERWIQESKLKQNRSLSLPNNYRGSPNAVKPASHRVDPVLPSMLKSKSPFKKGQKGLARCAGQYTNIALPVRKAITKKVVSQAKPAEFFENSLWRKEKEKCLLPPPREESNPQCCSTPYKIKTRIEQCRTVSTDQSTNTQTFEELCELIFKRMGTQDFSQTEQKPTKSIKNTECNDIKTNGSQMAVPLAIDQMFEKEKNTLMNELSGMFDNRSIDQSKEWGGNELNLTVTKDNQNVLKQRFDQFVDSTQESKVYYECDGHIGELMMDDGDDGSSSNQEEDCLSLGETKPNDIINKALKRCQAFSALTSARSTEDMYIDDELSVNNDTHALSDHMQLIPVHSSIHEALCDKNKDCCLLKMKEETCNDRLLIICDSTHLKNPLDSRPESSGSNYSEDDNIQEKSILVHPKMYHNFGNLHVENLPSMDLIDLTPLKLGLPVIEETSNEEDELPEPIEPFRNVRNIKQLIGLYESAANSKIAVSSIVDIKDNRSNEISFLIIDDDTECDGDHDDCEKPDNELLNNSNTAIQDYITI